MVYMENKTDVSILKKDNLCVKIFPDRGKMGKQAAAEVAETIVELLKKKEAINMIFASAPSQGDFLKELVVDLSIPWQRIRAFHMDEYIGLAEDAPQGFGNFLKKHLFDKVSFKNVYYLNGQAADRAAECSRYAGLLKTYPPDIVCLGIGENGHIAFNDPPVADFQDPEMVKIVQLEDVCRQQQVNDKCFETIEEVPQKAYTLTIPALTKADYMFCIVPTRLKAEAVWRTLNDPIREQCPATILRTKKRAVLYLDQDSASLL